MSLRFGLQKTTLVDYPGKVATLLFTAGCNLRCPYCHNPELVTGGVPSEFVGLDEIYAFLERRRSVLGGVVITGGEPLLHPELPAVVAEIQNYGLPVKLDTNGTFPEALAEARPDFVALDIKSAFSRYARLCPSDNNPAETTEKICRSIEFLINSGISHQFRTVMVPGIVDVDDFDEIIPVVKGADSYLVSGFRNGTTLDPSFAAIQPYPEEILESVAARLREAEIPVSVRPNRYAGSD